MTTVEFTVARKVHENGEWVEKEVTRKYQIDWTPGYASITNEDGFFVDDINLSSLKTKEERMQHVMSVLKNWK